jgi:hypothetical protein
MHSHLRALALVFLTLLSPWLAYSESSIRWVPMISYTPETRFGGGAFIIFNLYEGAKGIDSNIRFLGFVTQNKQWIVGITPRLFFFDGLLEFENQSTFQNFPSKYFGIGNGTSDTDSEI